mgnify:CR=1 FL=1
MPLSRQGHMSARSVPVPTPAHPSNKYKAAKMKLIPVHDLIQDKSLLLIDDSIVRGTQLRETTEFLYQSGAREVHIRPACPPLLFGCKYLNFSRSTSEMDLITRRVLKEMEQEVGVYLIKGLEKGIPLLLE